MQNNIQTSDEQLMKQFQEGDLSAYNTIVDRYKDRLINFIYRYIYDIDFAEDLVQDVLIKVYTHKHSYKEIAKFSTWVYTIAANVAKTELRKKKRRKTFTVSELSTDDREFLFSNTYEEDSPQDDTQNLRKNIYQALYELPDEFKVIIILRDIQELSYEDISNILQVPPGTVKSRISRGRLKLQKLLSERSIS